MKNFNLILLMALISFVSCNVVGQTETSANTISPMVHINVEEFKTKMQNEEVVILDVRTPKEIADGKIEGAIELDVLATNFSHQIQKLDKSKTYVVYCRSGRRSVNACNTMAEKGFGNLYNLLGGYMAWSK